MDTYKTDCVTKMMILVSLIIQLCRMVNTQKYFAAELNFEDAQNHVLINVFRKETGKSVKVVIA